MSELPVQLSLDLNVITAEINSTSRSQGSRYFEIGKRGSMLRITYYNLASSRYGLAVQFLGAHSIQVHSSL